MIMLKSAQTLPLSRVLRAKIYRIAGVDIEPGIVRIGKASMDTIYPGDIHIGRGTVITNGCVFITHFYDITNLREHAYYRGEIHIGRNCYIGTNAIFSKPVRVGDGAVVGAGSVVTKDIPPYEVWAGVPARFIRRRCDEDAVPTDTTSFKPM